MRHLSQIVLLSLFSIVLGSMKAATIEKDTFNVGGKSLSISFIGHGSLCIDYDGYIIQIDPVGRYTNYSQQPDADLILITHAHGDHLDANAVAQVEKANTVILLNEESQKKLQKGKVMKNGDTETINGIKIKAVPAYNPNRPQHPKGRDNGYLLEMGNKRIYVAGDTEDIPELANLKGIDIAFLPINRPTMTIDQAVNAARIIKPAILYPYHYGDTDVEQLIPKLADQKIDIRIRSLQ